MTEQDWKTESNPKVLHGYLVKKGLSNERKWRLFSCACCRRMWNWMTENGREAVELAERFADQEIDDERRELAQTIAAQEVGLGGTAARWAAAYLATTGALRVMDIAGQAAAYLPNADFDPLTQMFSLEGPYEPSQWDAEWEHQCHIIRDIFGNPFRPVTIDPSWHTPDVTALAQAIYDERRFADMPILADALEEAGCTNEDILEHCRSGGDHVRGCWVVDLFLGRQ